MLLVLGYSTSASTETNLALHKSYTLSPKPNYKLCTDEADMIQLTDGKSCGSYWVKKSTVGWRMTTTGTVGIEIVIDLKHQEFVNQVKIHSVGGGTSSVEFPEFIAVLVSKDGKQYGFAGLVSSEQLPIGGKPVRGGVPHIFVIDNLNTETRYIKLVVRPRRYFFFVDEIEVNRINQKLDWQTVNRKNLLQFSSSEELLVSIEDYLQQRENLRETIKTLQNNRNVFSADLHQRISPNLMNLSEKLKLPTNKIFSKNELSVLGNELEIIRTQIYKEFYKKPFVCFAANPMQALLEKDMQLVDIEQRDHVDINLWQGEYESSAVNIINCSPEVLNVAVSISPITDQDGESTDSHKTFTIRRAVFVRATGLGSIADALILQKDTPFQLSPGGIAQIWLTVFNPKLAAGDYKGTLAILASKRQEKFPIQTVPINLKIEKMLFPKEIALNTCVWDEYTPTNSVTKHVLPVASEDLRSHYTNISVIHPSIIPFPTKKLADGYLLGKMDFSKFDKQLEINDFARVYLLFFNWSHDLKDHGRFGQWMSPYWKRAFSNWLKILVEHLKQKGISYEEFALYPFDESLCDEFYEVSKLIKQVDPRIQIYANNFGKGPEDFMRFKDLVDIWSPHWFHCDRYPKWLATVKSFGKVVWTYGYGAPAPAKTKPPYECYRLLPWYAFKRGQTGAGFWVYIDWAEHAWNDTLKPFGYYGVIYGANQSPVDTQGEHIVPSRRWEAWREGIEDYEYLTQLRKVINQIRTSDPATSVDSESILNLQVELVLNNKADSETVYSARQIITETLLKLKEQQH